MNLFRVLRRALRLALSAGILGSHGALIAASPSGAQSVTLAPAIDKTPETLSLERARQIAFQNNWDLLAAKSNVDQALAQLIVAREFPNPTFTYSTAKISSTNASNPGVGGNVLSNRNYDTILAINQLVEIAGKRADRQLSAKAGILGARARFFDARRTLDQAVTKAYMAALLADENAVILEESAKTLQRESAIAIQRLKTGDISEADKRQIDNNADIFAIQAQTAKAAAEQARISLEVLLGVKNAAGHWRPSDSLEGLATPPHGINDLKPGVRPDVLAAQEDLAAAQAQVKLQKAYRIPDPTFLLQFERNPPGPPGPNTVGVGVSFPLPILNHNGGNIKAAEATVEGLVAALGKVNSQVTADLATSDSEYREASSRMDHYRKHVVPNSAMVLRAVTLAYDKGAASLLDLLSATRDHNANRQAEAQALSDTASSVADMIAARQTVDIETLRSAAR